MLALGEYFKQVIPKANLCRHFKSSTCLSLNEMARAGRVLLLGDLHLTWAFAITSHETGLNVSDLALRNTGIKLFALMVIPD